MIGLEDRQALAQDIEAAHSAGARLQPACEIAGIELRTLQRWKAQQGLTAGDGRPQAVHPTPSHALSPAERAALLAVANEPRFASVPPARIVPMLADEGVYLGSESSMARVLREHGQNARRGRAKAPKATRPPTTHIATAPGQVWCWDMSAPCRRGLQRQEKGEIQRSANRSWLILDRQLKCCLAPVEAGRKGAAKLGRLPTAGCHAQSSLNCTERGRVTAASRATARSMVRQRSVRRKPLYLPHHLAGVAGSCGAIRLGLMFPSGGCALPHSTMDFLPQPSSGATRGRARHLRT
jgi:hypothetical protein